MKPKIYLTQAQNFKLWDHLKTNIKQINASKPQSLDKVASALTAELGFTLTERHLRTAQEITGLHIETVRGQRFQACLHERIDALEKLLASVIERLSALEQQHKVDQILTSDWKPPE